MSNELKIKSVIGFSGKVPGALHYTPCGKYIVYPLGSFVVVKNLKTDKEAFLDGHSHEISCLAMSNDGRTIASGQVNITGVKVRNNSLCFNKLCFNYFIFIISLPTGRCYCLGFIRSQKISRFW